ncbi:MAG: lamin tail domain-containing protein, partial [Psychroserpens sp.]|nr:lamin tail domain-containing protein [Psychroserpens sp.]
DNDGTNPVAGDIVISEIMYNSSGGDDEWIELYNASGSDITLDANWELSYDGSTFNFAGTVITAGDYLTVALGSNGDGTYNNDNPFTPDAKPELFNIQDVFQNKIALVEQKVEQKRIVLIDESSRDFVYADRSMIEIVVQNLITNAIKFTRVGDVITVSNSDLNGKALLCVEDTGVGISRENISKLFQDSTFTTRGTDNEKGTGLGLTICKELVELNGGRIWVESTLNVGTKFYVELPKAKPAK